jgi:hypothetical protein
MVSPATAHHLETRRLRGAIEVIAAILADHPCPTSRDLRRSVSNSMISLNK